MAGKLGCGGGPLILFFPPCSFEPAMLEESRRRRSSSCRRMAVKTLPGSALEVIETQFFIFQLLMQLVRKSSAP